MKCPNCGCITYAGYARCENSKCQTILPPYQDHASVIVEEKGCCVMSGAPTDVKLPNGDYLWAPDLLEYLESGWIDQHYKYTQKFWDVHPTLKDS